MLLNEWPSVENDVSTRKDLRVIQGCVVEHSIVSTFQWLYLRALLQESGVAQQ